MPLSSQELPGHNQPQNVAGARAGFAPRYHKFFMFRKLTLLIALSAAACAQTVQNDATTRDIAAHLTAAGLRADVSFLASDALQGRGTPSPGLEIAAEYIAAQFRRAGLEPAGDQGYFQNAPFATITPSLSGFELTIDAAGQTLKADKSAVAFLEAAPLDLTRAAVISANPAAIDSFSPEQVRGKVLFMNASGPGMGIPRSLLSSLDRLDPALIILLRESGSINMPVSRVRDTSTPGARRPILILSDPAIRAAAANLKGATVSAHIAAPDVVPVKLHNVVGVLRGSDPELRDTYVLVTAHYDHLGVRGSGPGDHIFNGANDDASGTASVIEIANALAALPTRPKRSVVFIALFGEEMGLLGSRYYGSHPIFPLAKTIGDLNLEQLGRTDVDGGTRVGLVNVTGYDFSTLTSVLKKAGEETGLRVEKDEKNSDPFFARSDNQALADAGIPAHTLSVGYVFPDYHGAGDEWPKLDYDNMATVDRTIALAVYRVADSTEVPQWNAANPKTERYIKAK